MIVNLDQEEDTSKILVMTNDTLFFICNLYGDILLGGDYSKKFFYRY